uniref:hypothetical protein n=1 Tax=Azotobacter vinelandii TaxID=354 RepID=UPI001E4714B8
KNALDRRSHRAGICRLMYGVSRRKAKALPKKIGHGGPPPGFKVQSRKLPHCRLWPGDDGGVQLPCTGIAPGMFSGTVLQEVNAWITTSVKDFSLPSICSPPDRGGSSKKVALNLSGLGFGGLDNSYGDILAAQI